MIFPSSFIDKVREANNIVDIVMSHTQLRRSGGSRFVGLCPFHMEKTPSFSVNEDKQMYHCFGCKKAGNIFHFLESAQGLNFPEAVEFLAQRAGIPLPKKESLNSFSTKNKETADQAQESKNILYRINQLALEFFITQIQKRPPHVVNYLKERGLNDETTTRFQIGYSPNDWEALTHHLLKFSAPRPTAEALGLIRSRKSNNNSHSKNTLEDYYDIFRDRLMFPIILPTGKIVGFGGRVFDPSAHPKYLNSPESEVFHKGKILYGLNESAKHIRQEDRVIVVEGYMDFLQMFQAGFKAVVATLGTALTQEHARLLKRYTKNIIVVFDGDEAGQTAMERSLPLLLSQNLIPKGLRLPEKLDPDDFLRKYGKQSLEKQLRSAPELFLLVLDQFLLGFRGQSAEKINLLDKVLPILSACADKRLQHLYVSELAEKIGETPSWVKQCIAIDLRSAKNSPQVKHIVTKVAPELPQKPKETVVTKVNLMGAPTSELYLINMALVKEEYFHRILKEDVLGQLSHEGVKQVFLRAQQLLDKKVSNFNRLSSDLIGEVHPQEPLCLHLKPPLLEIKEPDATKLITDCIKKVKEARLRLQAKTLRSNLRGQNSLDQQEDLERIMNIHRDRHLLNKNLESKKANNGEQNND